MPVSLIRGDSLYCFHLLSLMIKHAEHFNIFIKHLNVFFLEVFVHLFSLFFFFGQHIYIFCSVLQVLSVSWIQRDILKINDFYQMSGEQIFSQILYLFYVRYNFFCRTKSLYFDIVPLFIFSSICLANDIKLLAMSLDSMTWSFLLMFSYT